MPSFIHAFAATTNTISQYILILTVDLLKIYPKVLLVLEKPKTFLFLFRSQLNNYSTP